MKKRVKRFLTSAIILIILLVFTLEMHAANEVNWYFKKNNEHKQPKLDEPLQFINNYSCYYVNKTYGDENEEKVIYLTFDAGYENGNIQRILDTLKEKEVKGAFFVLGHLIDKNTDLVKRMVDEGHFVCNHTLSHKNMAKVQNKNEFINELTSLEKLYHERIGGEMPKFYRPPEGCFSESNLEILEEIGYKTVLWSFAYADWDNNKQLSPQIAYDKLILGTHNGEILLLHPTSKTNADILGSLIDTWRQMGYRFGTLDEL